MHSGFTALRSAHPMNIKRNAPRAISPEVSADVRRVLAIWTEARARYGEGGPFLLGEFSIADAMYAPVVTRFRTYGIEIDENARAYSTAILERPSMARWIADAKAETFSIGAYDAA
jgi:glutathione S-transferase